MALSYLRAVPERGIYGIVAGGLAHLCGVGHVLTFVGVALILGAVSVAGAFMRDVRGADKHVDVKLLLPKPEVPQLGPYRQ